MSERVAYEYAVVRIVPRVDRDEFVNAGVIVFAKQHKLLASRTRVDESRILALWPSVDLDAIRRHLDAIGRICDGDESAGPIAKMSQSERFHWLTAPRSTMIQTSPVHSGRCSNSAAMLERLLDTMVR